MNKNSGFTLIEMMIALFLSALVMLLLIMVFDYHSQMALKMHYQNRVNQRAQDINAVFKDLFSFMIFEPICPYRSNNFGYKINIHKGAESSLLDMKSPQFLRKDIAIKENDIRSINALKESDILVANYLVSIDESDRDLSNLGRYLLTDCIDEFEDKKQFQASEDVSFYEKKTLVIYVVYERDEYALVINFADGSNFYRIPDVAFIEMEMNE